MLLRSILIVDLLCKADWEISTEMKDPGGQRLTSQIVVPKASKISAGFSSSISPRALHQERRYQSRQGAPERIPRVESERQNFDVRFVQSFLRRNPGEEDLIYRIPNQSIVTSVDV